MAKVNTFFSAASWYDNDDSKPYHQSHHSPIRATRIPAGNNRRTYFTDNDISNPQRNSYRLTDKTLISALEKRNEKILARNTAQLARSYLAFRLYIEKKNRPYLILHQNELLFRSKLHKPTAQDIIQIPEGFFSSGIPIGKNGTFVLTEAEKKARKAKRNKEYNARKKAYQKKKHEGPKLPTNLISQRLRIKIRIFDLIMDAIHPRMVPKMI